MSHLDIGFQAILNCSLKGSLLIPAVLLLRRLLMRRVPKAQTVWLWALTGIALLLPVWVINPFSLQPAASPATVVQDTILNQAAAAPAAHPLTAALVPNPEYSCDPMQVVWYIAGNIWFAGVCGMLLYLLISAVRLRVMVHGALPVPNEKRVYASKKIQTSFLMGMLFPRIYLPDDLAEPERTAVLLHERAHLRRGDHIWKLMGFLVLTVHWFNPLVWLAYALVAKDIELACDERAIRSMDTDGRKSYSEALLACSLPKQPVRACPLAFGETAVKERIRAVLTYRKPKLPMKMLGMLSVAAVPFFLGTNPYQLPPEELFRSAILCEVKPEQTESRTCAYHIMNQAVEMYNPFSKKAAYTMYAAALVREYAPAESGETVCVHETFLPVFIYVKGGTSYYEIADLRNANDDVLRAMKIYLPLANPDSSRWQKWHLSLAAECDAKAAEVNQ